LFWRHGLTESKAGAAVLAYALPPEPPAYMTTAVPDESDWRRRRDFERRQALVVRQEVGHGRVLFLGFNRTWRLRYRVGDLHHHKFWGQVVRWAMAGTPPFGNAFARIGTDRPVYAPDHAVRVRARLVQADWQPIVSRRVSARVFRDGRLAAQRRMEPAAGSAGLYEADLGALPEGRYRVELDAPDAAAVLGEDIVAEAVCELAVEPAVTAERVELTADRALLARLADVTGGVMAPPEDAAAVIAACGPPVVTQRERRQFEIWNSWPFLLLIVALGATEWVVRKRERLP
jgi:hypothetical protein